MGDTPARVLVAEDVAALAFEIEAQLIDHGYEVVGPFPSLPKARVAAESEHFSVALLDVHLRGDSVFPVVDICRARRIPVILLTAYDRSHLPSNYEDVPLLQKPVGEDDVMREIENALRSAAD